MAGVPSPNYLTLSDIAKQCHNQELVAMVDEFDRPTTLFSAMPWKQATDALRDVSGKVTAYPSAQYVGLDLGVKADKGNWTQTVEGLAMLESWAEINEKTYNVSPHKEATRWENDRMHIRAMAMAAEEGLLYGNPVVNQAQPRGFMPRFTKITDFNRVASGVKYDYCTLSAGGNTANGESSILIIAKGGMAPTLLYPRYQENNGLMYRHFDFENALDINGGNVRIAKSQFQITFGLSIRDTRTAVRVANIDTTNATSIGNIRDALFEAVAAIPREYKSSIEMYTTKKVILALRKNYAALVNPVTYSNNGLGKNSYGDILFDGFILHECESMLDTEAVVS